MSLISSIDDAENFSKHPVAAYDPFYTRDTHLFNSCWVDFVDFLRGLVASNPDTHTINYVNNLFYDAVCSCKAYERATGIDLISLHVHGSLMNSLYTD